MNLKQNIKGNAQFLFLSNPKNQAIHELHYQPQIHFTD